MRHIWQPPTVDPVLPKMGAKTTRPLATSTASGPLPAPKPSSRPSCQSGTTPPRPPRGPGGGDAPFVFVPASLSAENTPSSRDPGSVDPPHCLDFTRTVVQQHFCRPGVFNSTLLNPADEFVIMI
ncbi:hypothetical protein BJ508DRAFT_183005 [Ascobolus immersus RN42]|uniref:Uncharacterized protein n=1 Tax=Ascobolus immersus RN42 TaxID=1160509 RepID=A0A3N4I400_ASCIM|nr:hypothetical protein BJ508DRAFT_183005 [Ascobolus immersus RN42]